MARHGMAGRHGRARRTLSTPLRGRPSFVTARVTAGGPFARPLPGGPFGAGGRAGLGLGLRSCTSASAAATASGSSFAEAVGPLAVRLLSVSSSSSSSSSSSNIVEMGLLAAAGRGPRAAAFGAVLTMPLRGRGPLAWGERAGDGVEGRQDAMRARVAGPWRREVRCSGRCLQRGVVACCWSATPSPFGFCGHWGAETRDKRQICSDAVPLLRLLPEKGKKQRQRTREAEESQRDLFLAGESSARILAAGLSSHCGPPFVCPVCSCGPQAASLCVPGGPRNQTKPTRKRGRERSGKGSESGKRARIGQRMRLWRGEREEQKQRDRERERERERERMSALTTATARKERQRERETHAKRESTECYAWLASALPFSLSLPLSLPLAIAALRRRRHCAIYTGQQSAARAERAGDAARAGERERQRRALRSLSSLSARNPWPTCGTRKAHLMEAD